MASSKRSTMETVLSGSSISDLDQEELLRSAKAKMGEVREENERLKKLLVKIVKDYESLEKKVSSITRSQQSVDSNLSKNCHDKANEHDSQVNPELVSLSLGSWSSNKKKHDDIKKEVSDAWSKRRKVDGGLELGLECKFENYSTTVGDSVKNSTLDGGNEEMEEENNKTKENTSSKEGEEESLHPPQVKKTRVCIRSRCDTPTMNDGCQWRKYGQKIAKGNPCPRAYYRCTVSPSCPVRKQVQRCPDDMSILITTYEGTHSHPLPLSATTMASATTAIAAMHKSGSFTSSSQSSFVGPALTSSFGFHGTNLVTPFNHNPRLSISNPSMISASHNSHPTITLDLTTPSTVLSPLNWLSSSSSSSLRNSSNFPNFSSSSASTMTSLDFTTKPAGSSWGSGYLNYGPSFPYINNSSISNTTSSINISENPNNPQPSLHETITKAIAANPNFQSVLAAAISSYVGNKTTTATTSNNNSEQRKPSPALLTITGRKDSK
ncbi:hypothetical protein Cgig2_024825 [Carnegiea gigantea]|uniref:WRKY domain-containing protein n=1 Tax=Carnegiea gigantea TaxID=171969 RepID=A0A9Q1QG89_9CARY|nr:hypothetical protein Cgig2_024825 [Carnegiea gigantea]